MKTIKHPIRRHEALTEAGRYAHVSLPFFAGVSMAPDRAETAPKLRTIRAPKPNRIHGAALAAQAERKLDAIAATICGYRAAMMPAVTVEMEGL